MQDFEQESDAPIVIHVASQTNSRDKRSDNVQIIFQEISKFVDEPKDALGPTLDNVCRTNLGSILNHIRAVSREIGSSEIVGVCSSQCFESLSKIGFILFHLFAICNSVANFKHVLLSYTEKGNLFRSITTGYCFLKISIKVSYLKLILTKRQEIGSRFRKYGVTLLALTLLMSTVSSLFMDVGFSNWSLDFLILFRSHEFRTDVLVWSHENYFNLTEELIYIYGTELTPVTIFLGVSRVITDFCETLQDFCFVDIWLITALLIWRLAKEFNLPENTILRPDFEKPWTHYKKLRRISDMLEECMGGFLKQIHMNNLFLCTYFLLKCMEGDYNLEFWLMGVNIIKTLWAYYVAAAAVEMNNRFESWFLDNFSAKQTVKIGHNYVNISFVLHEMTRYRYGVGRRNFFIDQTFNMKFLGVVGSYFLILVESKAKEVSEQ
ncbi:unnamed protein product [Orchesella dallaii]|uniref:Gustatory receptor n=1 Tax=Orchesella dallaii TaxID=48710 RepID=A0ABP1R1K6_9HEXA